jgi:hypothetical protein
MLTWILRWDKIGTTTLRLFEKGSARAGTKLGQTTTLKIGHGPLVESSQKPEGRRAWDKIGTPSLVATAITLAGRPGRRSSARISRMVEMLRDLVAHKGHANAAVLGTIRQNDTAVSDPELCGLLHHILIANRFWLLAVLGLPFVFEDESRPSSSFDALIQRYCSTQEQESTWLATATEADLGGC